MGKQFLSGSSLQPSLGQITKPVVSSPQFLALAHDCSYPRIALDPDNLAATSQRARSGHQEDSAWDRFRNVGDSRVIVPNIGPYCPGLQLVLSAGSLLFRSWCAQKTPDSLLANNLAQVLGQWGTTSLSSQAVFHSL